MNMMIHCTVIIDILQLKCLLLFKVPKSKVCDPFMRTIFQLLGDEWKWRVIEAYVCAGEHVRYGVVYWRRASE
jgi:hypothetical protein